MGKPDMNQLFDKRIKDALLCKADEIEPQSKLLDRINKEIISRERENISMNRVLKIRRMKPAVIVAVILILSAATCFAATKITSLVGSSSEAFTQFPTERQVEKAVNYTPDYIEEFSNGFYFDSASVSNTAAMDGDNNKVGENKGISFFYTKEDARKGQMLTLSTNPEMPGMTFEQGLNEELLSAGDMDLIYAKVTFKVVPEGYIPTSDEEKQAELGTLWISYGSDQVEISDLQYLEWEKDGILYNLMDQGYGIDKDELIKMVQEILSNAE